MANTKHITRRQFLKIIAVGGIAGISGKLALDSTRQPAAISETRLLMGTVVNLTLIHADRDLARTAVQACFETMAGLESAFSRYIPESEISQLNQFGALSDASEQFTAVLTQSAVLSTVSGGAFDITVKPLLDLYQAHARLGKLPTVAEINKAKTLVDYRSVHVSGTSVAFDRPGMSITVDGIAKGYIVDQGVNTLRSLGFDDVMVEAGGDLLASGTKGEARPWRVGIRSPREEQNIVLGQVNVDNKAVATSGDYMQAFTPDYANHHIIDPRTGYSSPGLASVTIVAPTAAQADALATTVMVLGETDGLALIESLAEHEGYLVRKSLGVVQSSGLLS